MVGKSVCLAIGLTVGAACVSPAVAQTLELQTVEIKGGVLVVEGIAPKGTMVSVPQLKARKRASAKTGAFSFTLKAATDDCRLTVAAGRLKVGALIGNCGPRGEDGKRGPAGPQGALGPDGPSGPPGASPKIIRAMIYADGGYSSNDIVYARGDAVGEYHVQFNAAVSQCAPVMTPFGGPSAFFSSSIVLGNSRTRLFYAYYADGSPRDINFYVLLFCD